MAFADRFIWAHHNVEPWLCSGFLLCAASLSPATAYVFVASFLAWLVLATSHMGVVLYRRGLLRWIWETVRSWCLWFWQRVVALKNLYWVKVLLGLLLGFLLASTSLWAHHHLDVVRVLKDTLEFVASIPRYLFNSTLLIAAIQRWLNRVLLDHLVFLMSTVWRHVSAVIVSNMGLGLLYIVGAVLLVGLILALASLWSNSRFVH
ncbi:MAG TPA: hypothetical protein VFC02_09775 [Anaerolineales bacterium]|nr:hypothetical protein [Anaerolineales bacterium]